LLWFDIVAIKAVSDWNKLHSSMKFKFILKISIIMEKFLVFFNLLRVPDITRSGAGSGLMAMHSQVYIIK